MSFTRRCSSFLFADYFGHILRCFDFFLHYRAARHRAAHFHSQLFRLQHKSKNVQQATALIPMSPKRGIPVQNVTALFHRPIFPSMSATPKAIATDAGHLPPH